MFRGTAGLRSRGLYLTIVGGRQEGTRPICNDIVFKSEAALRGPEGYIMAERESVWARRFIGAAIIQGAAAFVIAGVMIVLSIIGSPSASRIIAAGSAGTWMLVGFSGFLIVGVLGVGLSALFYHYIEVIRGQKYAGLANGLAWGHLILMNIGASAASWLLILAGHIGGSLLLQGLPTAEVHPHIVVYVLPITIFMGIGALGVLLGGIGYVIQWRKGSTAET